MHVPYNDLSRIHSRLRQKMLKKFGDIVDQNAFIGGSEISQFEASFSQFTEQQHVIGCSNGTESLLAALKYLDLDEKDEVIVPSHTWIATSEMVTLAGGTPVFCDTNYDYFTCELENILEVMSDRVVGIIPVHLYGNSVDIDPIKNYAEQQGLWIIEDCAQAHGTKYKGNNVGIGSLAASYSFYPGKNLGAIGDCGALTTNDQNLAKFARRYINHGSLYKGEHAIEGTNARMDNLQAAILNLKLPILDSHIEMRRTIADRYSEKLKLLPEVLTPKTPNHSYHSWHVYAIRTNKRDELKAYLKLNGIDTIINYPKILPDLQCYEKHAHRSNFINSRKNAEQILSLPIFPHLTEKEIDYVVSKIFEFFEVSR